jgi:hypothetical protein
VTWDISLCSNTKDAIADDVHWIKLGCQCAVTKNLGFMLAPDPSRKKMWEGIVHYLAFHKHVPGSFSTSWEMKHHVILILTGGA